MKRKTFILFIFLFSMVLPLITMLYASSLPPNSWMDSFKDFYKMSAISYTGWIILPIFLGIFASMLFFDEYRNDTLKQLLVIPITKTKLLLSKICIVIIISIIYMFLTSTFTLIGAAIIGYDDMTVSLILRLYKLSFLMGLGVSIAMMPIIIVIMISPKKYILPISITVIYSFSGFILAGVLTYVHPISMVSGIVFHNNIEGILINSNILRCSVNLIVVGLISILLSIRIFNKQNY